MLSAHTAEPEREKCGWRLSADTFEDAVGDDGWITLASATRDDRRWRCPGLAQSARFGW